MLPEVPGSESMERRDRESPHIRSVAQLREEFTDPSQDLEHDRPIECQNEDRLGSDLLSADQMRQPADQWGFIGKMPKFKSDEVRDNWILSVLVRLLSAKWWEKRVNRCWDRLQCLVLK